MSRMFNDDRREPETNQVPLINGRRESDKVATALHAGVVFPDTCVEIIQRNPFVVLRPQAMDMEGA